MPRWEPDARERLVAAALDLFTENGYDQTTVTDIADRAGLTRSTFFRHFGDKREVLSAGQATLSALLVDGIAGATADATPLDAVAAGLVLASTAMTPVSQRIGVRLAGVIATSSELQERAMLKQVGMAAAMADALRARGVDDTVAGAAAELGVLAFKEAFARWSASAQGELAPMAVSALDRLRAALSELA